MFFFIASITSTSATSSKLVTTSTATHHKKPSIAESNTDDLSENLLYIKLRSFFHSATSIHFVYLFIAFSFFLLGIFYSTLAMRGEGINNSLTKTVNPNPLSLLFGNSHRTINHSNAPISLLSDQASLIFVLLLIIFYFLLSGIESSFIYSTYFFGIKLKFTPRKSLLIQFLFFLGLVLGRLIDILVDYSCVLLNTRIINRTKKQSDGFHLISIKSCILTRLFLLLTLCSILSFSHLFQGNSLIKSSIPSIHLFYFVYFSIGLLIGTLPTLILFWIEHDLSLNDSLIHFIIITVTISEIICPSFLFYTIKHAALSYLFYLFIGSCLLPILFLFILHLSEKWRRQQLYRILPTSMEIDEVNIENNSDNDDEEDYTLTNGRVNLNESRLNLGHERTKGLKEH